MLVKLTASRGSILLYGWFEVGKKMAKCCEKMMWFLLISCKCLMVVESILWEIRSPDVVDIPKYLCILERVSMMWLSFPTVFSMVESKVMTKSCYLLSFWLGDVCRMKVSRGSGFVRKTNLYVFNWALKNCRLLIIANSAFWRLDYVSCAGSNFQLWKHDELTLSRVHFHIHDSNPIWLKSHIGYIASTDSLLECLKICEEFTSSFRPLKARSYLSVQIYLTYPLCSSNRILAPEASPSRNCCKQSINLRNLCRFWLQAGVGNSSIVFCFFGSTCNLSEVHMCSMILNFLVKNWQLLSFTWNFCSSSYCTTFFKSLICSACVWT